MHADYVESKLSFQPTEKAKGKGFQEIERLQEITFSQLIGTWRSDYSSTYSRFLVKILLVL